MNLKELRAKHGLTQAALAKELGVSSKSISLIEIGKLKLSAKLAKAIKERFGEVIEPAEKKADAAAEAAADAVLTVEKKASKRGRKAKAKVQEAEPAVEMAAEAVTELASEVVESAKAAEKKTVRKARQTKAGKAIAEKLPKKAAVVIQSPFGGEITPEALLEKLGDVDAVYVRVDQNKAYWVKGDETGDIDLW